MSTEPTQTAVTPAARGAAGKSLLPALSKLAGESLRDSTRATFDSCDDLFFDLASRARNGNDQSFYFESLREIRQRKDSVITAAVQRLGSYFQEIEVPAPPQRGNQAGKHAVRDLQLITADQSARDAMVTDMVVKARHEFQQELLQLHQRLRAIAPQAFEPEASPFDPGRLTQAFVSACDAIDVEFKVLKVVLQQFDKLVLHDLEPLYHQANQLLLDAGILPQLPPLIVRPGKSSGPARRRRVQPGGDGGSGGSGSSSGSGSGGGGSGSGGGYGDTGAQGAGRGDGSQGGGMPLGIPEADPDMRELAQLLRRMRAGGIRLPMFPQLPAEGTAPTLSRDELVSLISDVQSHPPAQAGADAKPLDIRNAIEAIVTHRGQFTVGQADEDIINVVAMFFDIILDDVNVPLEIKALVSRLQIPVLKIALKDRTFFADRKHPTRQLINEIARTSIGWESSSKDLQDTLFVRLSELVERILSDGHDSTEVYQSCLAELTAFNSQAEQRTSKIEKRAEEKAAAEARTSKARDLVRHILHDRLEGQELPQQVSTFLIEEWQRVLQLILLKQGKDSQEWLDAVQALDDLVWSVQPHADEKSRARLERLLPDLHRRLHMGLEETTGLAEDVQAKLAAIHEIHRSLSSTDLPRPALVPLTEVQKEQIAPQASTEEKSWKEMTAVERQRVQYEALMYEFLKRADETPIGTWFVYEDLRRGSSRRCKLSARIAESGVFIFVNRFGVKVLEKPRKAFAYDLQMGHVRPLQSTPLFDRTLEAITTNLRKLTTEGLS